MSNLNGTYAIVTGASAGIGKYICNQLLADFPGLQVIGLSRREITDITNSDFTWMKCDVSDINQIEQVFKRIKQEFPSKKCSILINNAGHAKPVPLLADPKLLEIGCLKTDAFQASEAFSSMLSVNVLGLANCTRVFTQLMDHSFAGNIININSMSGHRVANSCGTHFYSCTKHAVTALTEGVRQELRTLDSKIRIGGISPGFVETDFFVAMNAEDAAFQEKMKGICDYALQSEDIYAAVKMMVTADARCQVGDVQIRPTKQMS